MPRASRIMGAPLRTNPSQPICPRDLIGGCSLALASLACLALACVAAILAPLYASTIHARSLGGANYLIVYPKLYLEYAATRFQIREGLAIRNEGCVITYDDTSGADYDVVFSQSRSIIGLLDPPHYSRRPIVMCDLDTYECWPCQGDEEERDHLFTILQAQNPMLERSDYWEP